MAQWIEHRLLAIGLRIFRQYPQRAGCHVLGNDCRPVAATRVEPVELLAVVTEFDGVRGHGICHLDPGKQLPLAVATALQILSPPVVGRAHGEADAELRIGEVPTEAVVRFQQRAVAGHGVDTKNFEEALVPLVVRDQQLVREVAGDLLDVAFDARPWCEGEDVACLQIDTMGLPVLVAALLAEEHDITVIGQPYEPGAEGTVGHPRERPRLLDVRDRPDPQVQHAIDRRQEGDAPAVRTDADHRPVGVGEQEAAGNQWHGDGGSPCRRLPPRRPRPQGRGTAEQPRGAYGGGKKKLATIERLVMHRYGPSARSSASGSEKSVPRVASCYAGVPDVSVPLPLPAFVMPDDHVLAGVAHRVTFLHEGVLPHLVYRIAPTLHF